MKKSRKLMAGVLIGVVCALAAWGLNLFGAFNALEHITWDQRQLWLAQPADPDLPIRVILLDEQSLEWARGGMGLSWPWPYEVYTPIIEFCRRGGAKAIAFDLQFTEPGRYGPADDQKLADTMAGASDFVAFVNPGEQTSTTTAWPDGIDRSTITVEGFEAYVEENNIAGLNAERCVFPMPLFAKSAAMLGHIGIDADEVIRRVRPVMRFDESDIPMMGLAAYLVGTKQTNAKMRIERGGLIVGDVTIPLDNDGRATFRYRKSDKDENGHFYRSYSAAAVIQSQLRVLAGEKPSIDPAEFEGCYVFFGLSATGLKDNHALPGRAGSPGVEVHATVLDHLLNNSFIRYANQGGVLIFMLLLSIAAGLAVVFTSAGLRLGVVWVAAAALPTVLGVAMFQSGIAWPIVGPTLGALLALVSATVFSLATEGKQRRFIRQAFGHYLSPTVIDRVLADPSLLKLGGERREVTVMFIDLAGFTSIAEKLEAELLSSLLNEYLSAMSEVILEEQGTLDKYQGDAVMAFWNAPLDQPDHALLACRAALRCKEKLVGLRRHWFDQTGREPRIRIGIHTGMCVVGNMGSQQRFDYTVLGDTANLASRLEGVNKVFGTTALVSESTWTAVDGRLSFRDVGRVAVVGRKEPVWVFEPYALDPKKTPPNQEAFKQALVFCGEGRFVDAMHQLQQLGDDPLARAYADKLSEILKQPQPKWDGVWKLLLK